MSNTTEHALYYRYLRGRAGDLLERDQSQSLTLAEQTAHALGLTTRGLGMLSSYDVALKVASMLDQKVAGGSRSPEEFYAEQLAVPRDYTPPSRDGVGSVAVTLQGAKPACTCKLHDDAGRPKAHAKACPRWTRQDADWCIAQWQTPGHKASAAAPLDLWPVITAGSSVRLHPTGKPGVITHVHCKEVPGGDGVATLTIDFGRDAKSAPKAGA